MPRFSTLVIGFIIAAVLHLPAAAPAQEPAEPAKKDDAQGPAFAANERLGRGLNLGNALEAPSEGDWGLTLKEEHFRVIAEAGFDSVRVPIRFPAHAGQSPPYRIDEEFFKRIDWVVEQGLSRDLAVIIDMHHYNAIFDDLQGERDRFLALWRQIAERYRDRPQTLYFELLNEPHGKLTAEAWNALIRDALTVVRKTNPKRMVIVGPTHWNNVNYLDTLALPENDRWLIVTFHYYLPFRFTHQGASWVDGSDDWLGTEWTGSPEEKRAVAEHFVSAAGWAKRHKRPVLLGEFGAYSRADMQSRARWTRFVRRQAEKHGFSWCYWEFGAGFGAYDRGAERWRKPLLSALLGKAGAR